MRSYLIALLKILEQRYPPVPNGHHIICFAQYGSDEEGWEDTLCLHLATLDRPDFFLDDDDFSAFYDRVAACGGAVAGGGGDVQLIAAANVLADVVTGLMVERGFFPVKAEETP